MSDLIKQIEQLKSRECVRILIVCQSSVGDAVCTLPVLAYLRAAFPNAKLYWFADSGLAGLLKNHPLLDDVIVAPKRWEESPNLIRQVKDDLRSLGLNVTIDAQGLPKTGYAAWLSSAPIRVGFLGSAAQGWNEIFNNYHVSPDGEHVVDQKLSLVKAMNHASIENFNPQLLFDLPSDRAVHDRMLAALKTSGLDQKTFYLVNVGCSNPSRRWSPDRFVEVIRRMGDSEGAPAVLTWGNEDEREYAVDVICRAGRWAHLAPKTDLQESAELARQAALFLSNDTGPLHIAAAVGTRCVSLHGPTNSRRTGPYGSSHCRIQSPLTLDSPEDLDPHDATIMDAIDVETVYSSCREIWKAERSF